MTISLNQAEITVLATYHSEVERELVDNILAFYINRTLDPINGGFYGLIANDLTVDDDAPKGLIQVTRILWAFAQSYRILGNPTYREIAERAYAYLLSNFWNDEFGGLFWMLDTGGRPIETFKMVYGQAFGIYGLSEHALATGDPFSLAKAVELYRLLEAHAVDREHEGYWEACRPNWTPDPTLAVDTVRQPVLKSMNTHLHVMEAYTNLLRVWPDDGLAARLSSLIRITIDKIVAPSRHFALHFDATWRRLNDLISYGHDIEGSWLLVEAAEVLGNPDLLAEAETVALNMAEATLAEGIDTDGGIVNEGDLTGIVNFDKDWWPQAEAMVGFLNAFQLTGDRRFLDQSLLSWHFVKQTIIDRPERDPDVAHEARDWFWGVTRDGRPRNLQRTGPWKGPYHNGRACMEVMRRVDALLAPTSPDWQAQGHAPTPIVVSAARPPSETVPLADLAG